MAFIRFSFPINLSNWLEAARIDLFITQLAMLRVEMKFGDLEQPGQDSRSEMRAVAVEPTLFISALNQVRHGTFLSGARQALKIDEQSPSTNSTQLIERLLADLRYAAEAREAVDPIRSQSVRFYLSKDPDSGAEFLRLTLGEDPLRQGVTPFVDRTYQISAEGQLTIVVAHGETPVSSEEGVIKEYLNQRNEKGGRVEMAEKEKKEMEILKAYLPPEISDEELASVIKMGIADSGAHSSADLPKVMKIIMPKLKGKADGNRITSMLKTELSNFTK